MNEIKIKEALLKGKYITPEDAKKAEAFSKEHNIPLLQYFLTELVDKTIIGKAIAESLSVPYIDLGTKTPNTELVLKIPQELAKRYRMVAAEETKDTVTVATDDPNQTGLKEELAKIFPKQKVIIAYAITEDLDDKIAKYRKSLETRFSKIIESQTRIAPEIIEEIFSDALLYHASDIHFEPQGSQVIVRFRVDGVLQQAGHLPREYYENILNRIKVQSRLRIDEHLTTQDGSMRFEKNGHKVDLRTSIVPTVDGEKIVLRVLSSYIEGLKLSDIGLSEVNQRLLQEAADKPFGMILVTGPTGSGKTTTLYSLLQILNSPDVNITTIEDPVEYKVTGVNQIQINPQTGLLFATGLRSIVRQDPDIILVGEIRDIETAEIAINAALTGHLLLSTYHANDAATAIPRLLDMNAEPFLLASTLDLIIAQRLVRKICEHCRHSVMVNSSTFGNNRAVCETYLGKGNVKLYAGKGCSICGNTGFNGRTAIFEFIKITPEMQDLILRTPSTKEIWEVARKQGSLSLFEDGLEKVKNGITTLEELLRVAEPPDQIGRLTKNAKGKKS